MQFPARLKKDMSARALSIALVMTLSGCMGNSPLPDSRANFTRLEIYSRGDGLDAIGCSLDPDLDACVSSDWRGYVFRDCSNEEFACVFDGFNVMAVPKHRLVPKQSYTVFGSVLTVDRCFGEQAQCEQALISSVCADEGVCSCRRAGIGKTRAKFFYSHELGITAFYAESAGSSADIARIGTDESELKDAIPLRTYVLGADKGFLRRPLKMRTAKLKTGCESPGVVQP
jgi:hypothetical protein